MYFHRSEIIKISVNNEFERSVCPECVNHKQMIVVKSFYDCKNLFYLCDENDKKVVVGQCCCWSEVHRNK